MSRRELKDNTWVVHKVGCFSAEADQWLLAIPREMQFEVRTLNALGKMVEQPRLMGWAGKLPYRYSGQTLQPRAVTPVVKEIWRQVEAVVGASFNHVVVNLYRDGRDHVALHADNEPELGQNPLIASVSLGATRLFEMKHKSRKRTERFRLAHGDLHLSGGRAQRAYRHRITVDSSVTEPRINLTFRQLLCAPGEEVPERLLAPVLRWQAPELSKLGRRCFRQTFAIDNDKERLTTYLERAFCLSTIEEQLHEDGSESWFMMQPKQGAPMGYLTVRERDQEHTNLLHVHRLYLLSRFVGRGDGSSLLNKAVAIAKERNREGLWLTVWEHNQRALAFYLSNGFSVVGEVPFDMGGELQNDLVMVKRF